eukprot:454283-Amphidinium_carterae.1
MTSARPGGPSQAVWKPGSRDPEMSNGSPTSRAPGRLRDEWQQTWHPQCDGNNHMSFISGVMVVNGPI